MDYTVDQKKDMDSIKREYFLSIADNENYSNIWRSSKKEDNKTITAPAKMLELTDKNECIGLQIKQIAGHFFFATIISQSNVSGYICNLKAKDKNVVKKCDFKVVLDKEIIKKSFYILNCDIINETEMVIFKGNAHRLDAHYITYLNDVGESAGMDIIIQPETQKDVINGDEKNGDVKMLGLEHDQIHANSTKLENGIFKGVDLDKLEEKVEDLLKKPAKPKIKTGSLVSVLEQSLHANDIETITWVLSNTDLQVINETVSSMKKESLSELMNAIMIKLQQGAQKSSLLWLGIVLKLRWLDVIKFRNNISTVHTYLSRKSKNLSKYYELQAKLQMVVDSGIAMTAGADMEVDLEEESKQPLVYQKDESESEADEIVEDIDLADEK